ncbi:putative TIM-barrel fold metal-dependent hydrolase [Lachnospiraceae bacterium JC7]|nr:putative TIM-barrel fold metal-dependent hydrolase [Lachnospiraceae bacterium JC7]
MPEYADYIIISDCIFDSVSDTPYKGFIAIKGNSILDISEGDYLDQYKCEDTILIHSKEKTVMAGAVDVHCFFAGYAGKHYQKIHDMPDTEPSPELLKNILNDKDFIIPFFKNHMKMLNSKGITTIKEMGFDDYYGFTDSLEKMEADHDLTVRFNFMSQPVLEAMNINYGLSMRNKFNSDLVKFSGFNMMTDGSVSDHEADLKQPYSDSYSTCHLNIEWNGIEKDVLTADEHDFRFSLHAQGDAAIAKCIGILNKCKKDRNGKLINRHSMTDLELSDPSDLAEMGRLNIVGEIYPQIQSLYDRAGKLDMIEKRLGEWRSINYWNRRYMLDHGMILSCGTDLPLLMDNIPESIYHAVYGMFPDSDIPFNESNMMTVSELLKAWTYGGAYNLSMENIIGTLEKGKRADIVIFDGNLFETDLKAVKNISVETTIFDGKIVYQKQ